MVALGLTGVVLGVLAELTGYLPHPWQYLSQLAAPWLVLAFAAGRPWRRVGAGATAGVALIVTGLLSYTAYKVAAYGTDAVRPLQGEWPFWLALAVGLGAPMGVAGAVSRARSAAAAAVAWALPVAVLVAEAGAVALGLLPWGLPLALAELAAALLLAAVATRHVRPAALAVAVAGVSVVALALVPVVQRLSPVS